MFLNIDYLKYKLKTKNEKLLNNNITINRHLNNKKNSNLIATKRRRRRRRRRRRKDDSRLSSRYW
jgi:hypothetical protein